MANPIARIQEKISDPNYDLIPFGPGANANRATYNKPDYTLLNTLLDRGLSYEAMSPHVNMSVDQIREYTDRTRPGYGVSTSGNKTENNPNRVFGYNTGGGSTPAYDPATIAELERQLGRTQDSIGRIGGQQKTALQNLLGAYNDQVSRLQNQYTRNEQDYLTNKQRTTSDFARSKERIADNVRQNINSLQSLLASRGAGSSSASQIMAPYAAARAGTSEREQAGQDFSTNMFNLNRAWDRYRQDFDQSKRDLATQRSNQERSVKSQFASREVELRNTLADLQSKLAQARGGGKFDTSAIDRDITRLLNQIDALSSRNFSNVIKANDPRYATPEMETYDVQSRGVEAGNDPTYDETQAFYPVREDEEDRFLQSLYA